MPNLRYALPEMQMIALLAIYGEEWRQRFCYSILQISIPNVILSPVNGLLRFLKAKSRNEIRGGKLWEITRLWGWDIRIVEKEVAKPEPLVRPEGGKVDAMRVHVIGGEDNITNLTKNPDLL